MGFLKTKLNDIEHQKVIGQIIHTQLRWWRKGDVCTKEFFVVVWENFKEIIFTKLYDNQGQVIREKKDLDKNCTKLYSKLYEKGDMSKKTIRIQSKMLDVVIIHFIDEMNNKLEQPIIKKDLKRVVEEMAIGKAPRLDGIAL